MKKKNLLAVLIVLTQIITICNPHDVYAKKKDSNDEVVVAEAVSAEDSEDTEDTQVKEKKEKKEEKEEKEQTEETGKNEDSVEVVEVVADKTDSTTDDSDSNNSDDNSEDISDNLNESEETESDNVAKTVVRSSNNEEIDDEDIFGQEGEDGYLTQAEEAGLEYSDLYEDVLAASDLLAKLFEKGKERKERKLKKMCDKNDWDLDLTMQSFYDQPPIIEDVDLSELLAVCCVVLEKARLNVAEVDFIKMDVKEETVKEYSPLRIDRYRKVGDGKYERNGYEYLTQPGYVWRYEKDGDYFVRVEKVYQEPELTETQYGVAELSAAHTDDILEQAGIYMSDVKELYDNVKLAIEGDPTISEDALIQTIVAEAPGNYVQAADLDGNAQQAVENALSSVEGNRRQLLETALTLVGKVPYLWGGKSKKAGYDTTWWTFNSAGRQKGLDCSGFVQWAYRTAGYEDKIWKRLISTGSISQSEENISSDQLIPGDLGLFSLGGAHNHVGIYIGEGFFIHCSSSRGTVVVSKVGFKVFKRVPEVESAAIEPVEVRYAPSLEFNDDDVDIMAKTMWHEARGEGVNGWVGVGEVIVNRMRSSFFPYAKDVRSTVYAEGQFSGNEEIEYMQPSDLCYSVARSVLSGQMRVFGNKSVLFFRNPGPQPVDGDVDWGSLPFFRRIANTCFYTKK